MSVASLACLIAAFVIVLGIGAGAIEAVLPGGRWNPYSASTVEKNHTALRVVAYTGAIGAMFAFLALASWLR